MIRTPQDNIEEMEEEAAADYVNAPARTGKKMAARPEEMEEEAAANYVNAPARTGKKMAACP
ncbi:hypothetical protein FQN60_011489, partial [Etheostoma spectabile]